MVSKSGLQILAQESGMGVIEFVICVDVQATATFDGVNDFL